MQNKTNAAKAAVYIAFIGNGLIFASFASRIPQIKDHLDLNPSQLGWLLFAIATGAVTALPITGPVIHRLGSCKMVRAMSLLMMVAFTWIGLGYLVGVVAIVPGLFLAGFANAGWDVAMNIQGAAVEQRLRKSIMSRFHAGFSVGTVGGALIGAIMIASGVPVTVHLIAIALVTGIVVLIRSRAFVDEHTEHLEAEAEEGAAKSGVLDAWKEPRTLAIGFFVLAFASSEGTGNDWISVATIEGYGLHPVEGTLAFASFLVAMTVLRWFGPQLLDRFGRVVVLRACALSGFTGSLIFILGASLPAFAFAGAVLWGLGVSLGFPVGMSAGADDPKMAARRVSVIATLGYCAFLGGPPIIGFLGNHFSVLNSLYAVAVLMTLSALLAGFTRKQESVLRVQLDREHSNVVL